MKKVMTLAALVAIAFAAGVGTVVAVTDSYFVANGTGTSNFIDALLDQHKLMFTNSETTFDQIHMYGGNDRINLGTGDDMLGFANGNDVLDLSGGHGYITWGLYTSSWPSPTAATNYISCDTPDTGQSFDTSMEIRSDEVTIKSNTGDVVIQLGGS